MGISVVGGSTTTTQDKTVVYGTPGSYTFTPPAGTSTSNPLLCEVTVVGAGGGGGNYVSPTTGSGGGAGQVMFQENFYVTGPTSVTVGAGGAAATAGGNSAFGNLVALGGAAGATSNSATAKQPNTDDCTKGAAGASAARLFFIDRGSAHNVIAWKNPSDFGTTSFDSISKPPFTSPSGSWSAATNGTHIVAANTYVNNSVGGDLTAFYSSGTGWTIRSVPVVADAQYVVTQIGSTVLCFPGGSANTTTYYYATTGNNTWTTGNTGHATPSNSYGWKITRVNRQTEIIITRRLSNNARRTVDGINWTNITLPAQVGIHYSGSHPIAKRATGDYVYFPAGYLNNNTVYTSPDLVNWTTRTTTTFSNNANAGNYADYGLLTSADYFWFIGAQSDSNYTNTFYSSDGYNWAAYGGFDGGWSTPAGCVNDWNLLSNGVLYISGYQRIRYGTFWATGSWYPNGLTSLYPLSLNDYILSGVSNVAPTSFPGITNLQPTGGSSGVPSIGGDGGNGGGYLAPTTKSTVNSAPATPGQVPGAGGGGGGAGSPTGASGANGLVSIKYYG